MNTHLSFNITNIVCFEIIPLFYIVIWHISCSDDLLDLLTQKYGVRAIVQYYPLYRYPLFQKKDCGAYDCPVLAAWWDNSFSFPWWCGIDDESMRIMCERCV